MSYTLLTCVDSKVENSTKFYGRFELGPFAPGQGLTVANALRRSLLSQVSGIAITLLEIEGASHEYEILNGIRESILDITLNLKEIVLTSDFEIFSPQVGFLNVKGPGKICASDLKLPSFIYVVDPNQYVATLTTEGRLNMKFLICCGKNYITQNPDDSYYSKWFLKLKKAKPTEALYFKNLQIPPYSNPENFFKATTLTRLFVKGNAMKNFAKKKKPPRRQKNVNTMIDSQKPNLNIFKFLMIKKKNIFSLFLPLFLYQRLFQNSCFVDFLAQGFHLGKANLLFGHTNGIPMKFLFKTKMEKKKPLSTRIPFLKKNTSFLISKKKQKSLKKEILTLNFYEYWKKERFFLNRKRNHKTILFKNSNGLSVVSKKDTKIKLTFIKKKKLDLGKFSEIQETLFKKTTESPFRFVFLNKLDKQKPQKNIYTDLVKPTFFDVNQSFSKNKLIGLRSKMEGGQKELKSKSETEWIFLKKSSEKTRIVKKETKSLLNKKKISENRFQPSFKKRGYFPIDAIFMPVVKVNYLIESTGFKKPKDLIILEIWTNGSIHPRKAIHEATKSLMKLFLPLQQFEKKNFSKTLLPKKEKNLVFDFPKSDWNSPKGSLHGLSKIQQKQTLNSILPNATKDLQTMNTSLSLKNKPIEKKTFLQSDAFEKKKEKKGKTEKNTPSLTLVESKSNGNYQLLQLDLGNLKLTARLFSLLKKSNINTIGALITNSKQDLLSIKGFGPSSVVAIENTLLKLNLSLKKETPFSG